jgi:hypothetical protein
MRTHNYKMVKGYKEPFKDKVVSWQVPEIVGNPTTEQIIAAGLGEAVGEGKMFDSVSTLLRRAIGAVNIDRGHKIRDAVDERPKTVEKDGKKVTEGRDGSKLTLADLAAVALSVNAKATDRVRGEGSKAKKAERYDTTRKLASEKAKTYTPDQLKVLADLGMLPEGVSIPEGKRK